MKPSKQSALAILLLAAFTVLPASSSAQATVAEEMAAAANDFLDSLDDEQRKVALFELKDEERQNWHFIPKDRNGLTLKRMKTQQRQLGYALLATAMSSKGLSKALRVMTLEHVLWELSNKNPIRDHEKYYFSIFGKPAATGTWGWRVEGHHLSLNFTVVNGRVIAGTPSFFASNPARVLEGPRKGLRVLAAEEDLARALVKSLNKTQREAAIFSEKPPRDIITRAERKVSPLVNQGIVHADLSEAQRSNLMKLIREYVECHRPELASADLAKIETAGLDKIRFAWAGGLESGQGHYYRVQGPTFLLEYANTQGKANHVHAVWRDFKGDFGEDVLAKHFAESHGE
ncbi:MAG: hypothetical protein CMO80_18540 [Verrucomicrobiales bacterium]|nr:hypothetical protein [Verrucomicrobiales bacterium]|tara:strand:+ start:22757 stop:23791 length:1035 start_codon:yes stop_codon:yes gene_type:complete